MTMRRATHRIRSVPTQDGAGVRIRRIGGEAVHKILDPFLMIDEFRSDDAEDYIAGFPSHPHRGFETITYLLAGKMRHSDHLGNEGLLQSGGVQWMTAGRGVIHSEMPEQEEGLMFGFQIWLNLPATDKLIEPGYKDFAKSAFPVVETDDGVKVRVISGNWHQDMKGPATGSSVPISCFDVTLPPLAKLQKQFPESENVLVLAYEGSGESMNTGELSVFCPSKTSGISTIELVAGEHGLRAMVLAGEPLREPIVQHGPFVMNTRDEIEQAISDYNQGRLTA